MSGLWSQREETITWVSLRSGSASSGTVRIAHRPPMMAAATRMSTTILFLAENSMIALIILLAFVAHAGHVHGGGALGWRLQLALGIDQEAAGRDHPLARFEPRENLDAIAAARAGMHLARLEESVASIDVNHLPLAGVQHRFGGDGQPRRLLHGELDLCVHVGLERQAGVAHVQAHLVSGRRGIHLRLDVFDPPGEGLPGQGLEKHLGPLAEAYIRHLVLEHIRRDRYLAGVDDGVEVDVGRNAGPGSSLEVRDVSRHGRKERDGSERLAGAHDLVDLRWRHSPQLQTAPAGLKKRLALVEGSRQGGVFHPTRRLGYQQQLSFSGQHFWTVERHQRGILLDLLAYIIHEDLLHPAVHLAADAANAGFVDHHPADGAESPRPAAHLRLSELHAD